MEYAKGYGQKESTAKAAALRAGYPEKMAAKMAYRLLGYENVERRIRGIMAAAAEIAVMDINERKIRLSKIARGKKSDQYQAVDKMGVVHDLKSKMLGTHIDAIKELNKLDGAYAPDKLQLFGGSVFEFVVKDNKGKEIKLESKP